MPSTLTLCGDLRRWNDCWSDHRSRYDQASDCSWCQYQMADLRVMTHSPLTVKPDDLVLHAARLSLMQFNIRNLPVVKRTKLLACLQRLASSKPPCSSDLLNREKSNTRIGVKAYLLSLRKRRSHFWSAVGRWVAPETMVRSTMIMDAAVDSVWLIN